MVLVTVLAVVGVIIGLNIYTHHGERIEVPDVRHHSEADATRVLEELGLEVVVNDTGYVKSLPPGAVLEQSPEKGAFVKAGRVVYITINALSTPTIVLPDIIDNSSLREAQAKLKALGFKLGAPQYVTGEKDWVYGVKVRGRDVSTGDRISVEDVLYIQVGSGVRDVNDTTIVETIVQYPTEEELEEENEELKGYIEKLNKKI